MLKNSLVPLLYLLLCIISVSCLSDHKTIVVRQATESFFETYAAHHDFDRFLSYYAENAVLEDMVNGDKIVGKPALKKFLDWGNPNFKRESNEVLIVEKMVCSENHATVSGYFTPFSWQTTSFEGMQFTIILTYDDQGKIIKQVDWVNYPATLVDYQNRKNSNDWIKK